jgi:SAM-dependent methyltransferase
MPETLDLVAALQQQRADELREEVRRFVQPRGDERALDVGSGLGALAFALAPLVAEVVAVELDPARVERARALGVDVPNVTFVVGDGRHLDLPDASFHLVGTLRTLHHTDRPELVIAELARVSRPGATVLVVDQLGSADPLRALDVDRFERARDPTHTRALPDVDLRQLFEANGLALDRFQLRSEVRELGPYLDLAGCQGPERERALRLAPDGPQRSTIAVGWYLLRRQHR